MRIARALDALMGRTGPVLADRYHDRVLRTPRHVTQALLYVLCNAARHGVRVPGQLFDPFSSAAAFDGWVEGAPRGPAAALRANLVAPARTWLLARGWRRAGPLDPHHCPGA